MYGVRPYITTAQATAQFLCQCQDNVRRQKNKLFCATLFPGSLSCRRGESTGNNCVFPQDFCCKLYHYLFQLCNYRNNLIHLVIGVLTHSYLKPPTTLADVEATLEKLPGHSNSLLFDYFTF